ncbi:RNA-directed DNA polymerase from mobile element jockey-like protein, partial [Aphelenchoides avenae]
MEVGKRLKSLKAKQNHTADGISSVLLKLCARSLSLPLAIIFNVSMESGIVPELFKSTYVVPVFKKEPPVVQNFRPVSDLLPSNQFGFRARHSVTDALLGCMDDWTLALETDFSSAFDKLRHSKLLSKLAGFGVESYLLQWIHHFLINLYTADLLKELEGTCTVVAYADDLKFYRVYDANTDTNCVQEAIDITDEWSDENGLPLNPENVDGIELSKSETVKDLGLMVASNLSMSPQVDKVCKSANARLFTMVKILKCKDLTVLTRAYTCYVRPILETAAPLFNGCNKGQIRKIERVQQIFTRVAMQRSRPGLSIPPYKERCELLKLDSLERRRHFLDLKLAKKTLLSTCAAPN